MAAIAVSGERPEDTDASGDDGLTSLDCTPSALRLFWKRGVQVTETKPVSGNVHATARL